MAATPGTEELISRFSLALSYPFAAFRLGKLRTQARAERRAVRRSARRHKMVDLTHASTSEHIYWPTDTAGFRLTTLQHGLTPAASCMRPTPQHCRARRHAPRRADSHSRRAKQPPTAFPSSGRGSARGSSTSPRRSAREPDSLLGVQDIEASNVSTARSRPHLVLVRTGW